MRLTCLLSRGVTAGAFTSRPFGNETKRNGMEGPGGLGDAVDLTPSKPRPHLRHPRPDRKPVWKIGLQTADQRAHVDMRACGPASASAKTEGRRFPFVARRAVLKHASLQRAGSRMSKPAPPPPHTHTQPSHGFALFRKGSFKGKGNFRPALSPSFHLPSLGGDPM